jgi:hypothetical protein
VFEGTRGASRSVTRPAKNQSVCYLSKIRYLGLNRFFRELRQPIRSLRSLIKTFNLKYFKPRTHFRPHVFYIFVTTSYYTYILDNTGLSELNLNIHLTRPNPTQVPPE